MCWTVWWVREIQYLSRQTQSQISWLVRLGKWTGSKQAGSKQAENDTDINKQTE